MFSAVYRHVISSRWRPRCFIWRYLRGSRKVERTSQRDLFILTTTHRLTTGHHLICNFWVFTTHITLKSRVVTQSSLRYTCPRCTADERPLLPFRLHDHSPTLSFSWFPSALCCALRMEILHSIWWSELVTIAGVQVYCPHGITSTWPISKLHEFIGSINGTIATGTGYRQHSR